MCDEEGSCLSYSLAHAHTHTSPPIPLTYNENASSRATNTKTVLHGKTGDFSDGSDGSDGSSINSNAAAGQAIGSITGRGMQLHQAKTLDRTAGSVDGLETSFIFVHVPRSGGRSVECSFGSYKFKGWPRFQAAQSDVLEKHLRTFRKWQ